MAMGAVTGGAHSSAGHGISGVCATASSVAEAAGLRFVVGSEGRCSSGDEIVITVTNSTTATCTTGNHTHLDDQALEYRGTWKPQPALTTSDATIKYPRGTTKMVIDVPSLKLGRHVLNVGFACQTPDYQPHPLTATFTMIAP